MSGIEELEEFTKAEGEEKELTEAEEEAKEEEAEAKEEEKDPAEEEAIKEGAPREEEDEGEEKMEESRVQKAVSEPDEFDQLEALSKAEGGGPYIGPQGGRYEDPEHTKPYKGDAIAKLNIEYKEKFQKLATRLNNLGYPKEVKLEVAKMAMDDPLVYKFAMAKDAKEAKSAMEGLASVRGSGPIKKLRELAKKAAAAKAKKSLSGTDGFDALEGAEPMSGINELEEFMKSDGGESLEETDTKELHATYEDLQHRLKSNPEDAESLQSRLQAIQGELKKRGELSKSGGPYIGPRGGKYADPDHKIPWTEKFSHLSHKEMGDPGDPHSLAHHVKMTQMERVNSGTRFARAMLLGNPVKASDYGFTEAEGKTIMSAMKEAGHTGKDREKTVQGQELRKVVDRLAKEGKIGTYKKSLSGMEDLEDFAKAEGGPFIGPRGGKWADAAHTIPWADHEKASAKGKKAKPVPRHTDEDISPDDISELELYADNDYQLYKQKQEFHKNVVRKMSAGKYDHAQASKLWGYFADRVAKKYQGEFGGSFDKTTRNALANKMADDFHDEVKANPSEFEEHVPKKYKKDWGKKSKTKKSLEDSEPMFTDEDLETLDKSLDGEEFKMSGMEELEEFAKSKSGAGGLPTGEPKMGGVGGEQGGPLAGKGKTSGSTTTPNEDPKPPKPKKQKLSEDDAEDEQQMKPHKKPIERTAKSFDTSSQGQRDQVAHENAQTVSRLQKGEEHITAGAGVASPAEPEPELQKSREWNQGPDSVVTYSDEADRAVEEFQKSSDFYTGAAPSVGERPNLVAQKQCPTCKGTMSKSLTACPHCGTGQQHAVQSAGQVNIPEYKGAGLKPAPEQVLHLPQGYKGDE